MIGKLTSIFLKTSSYIRNFKWLILNFGFLILLLMGGDTWL